MKNEIDTMRQCFDNPEKVGDPRSDEENLDNARVATKSLQLMAIRRIDDSTVDLKFKVEGWGDAALMHRLKKTKAGWKFDAASSTRDADW